MVVDDLKNYEVNNLKFEDLYVRDINILIRLFCDCLIIIDLENALKAGKQCDRYMLTFDSYINEHDFKIKFIKWLNDYSFAKFIKEVISNKSFLNLNIKKNKIKGLNTFSPFVEVKPIKNPSKWTIRYFWKAILANQIKNIYCLEKLTDNYLLDSKNNFGKSIVDQKKFAKNLIESPSGWVIEANKKSEKYINLTIRCHFYKQYTAKFII